MRDFVNFDSTNFPIVVSKYKDFIPTREEFVKAQADLEHFINTNANFVLLVDLSVMPYLPPEYRISQAKWLAKNNHVFTSQKIPIVYYTPSVVAQLMIRSVFIVVKPAVPYAVVTSLEKAEAWAAKQVCKFN
jgi:hypothetical protein